MTLLDKSVVAIHALIAELRAAITAKRAELRRAKSNPRPPAEVLEAFKTWVDQTAAAEARQSVPGLIMNHFGSTEPRPGAPWSVGQALTWGQACLFFGELLKQSFAALVGSSPPYEPGPPEAERPALVERLEAELAVLEPEEEAFVDEAAAGGLTLEHRPEVVQRRAHAARLQELAAEAAAARREREAALNEAHVRATRSVPSPYLNPTRGR